MEFNIQDFTTMKKEMIFPSAPVRDGRYGASRPSVFAAFKGCFLRGKAVRFLSVSYGRLLGTRVTPSQALRLLHAQLAFALMVFPLSLSPFVRFLSLGWFALTVAQCRRAGLK